MLGIAKNHKLLEQIRVNPVLADSLGAGNALFKDASQATGLLDVTIVQCDKVPLGGPDRPPAMTPTRRFFTA